MDENNYLVTSFENSIGTDIAELTGEALEFTLDTCIGEDSIMKDIPFVGTAIKLFSIGNKVHDKHSFYKLQSFIKGVNTGTGKPGELDERRGKFISDPRIRKQQLEYLLILIDRYIGFEKPAMLGKLYISYIDGVINWDEFTKYAESIDRFLPGDQIQLFEYSGQSVDLRSVEPVIDCVQRLVSMGLLTERIQPVEFFSGSGRQISTIDMEGYALTPFGEKLANILR